jgi:hypothetical protein
MARIGAPIAGGILGSLLGPLGTAGGAGLGGMLGEYLAEKSQGQEVRPGNIVASGALSAIPGGRVVLGAGKGQLIKSLMGNAAKGGALSGTANVMETVVDENRLPSWGEFGGQVAQGAALGAGGAALGAKLQQRLGGARMNPAASQSASAPAPPTNVRIPNAVDDPFNPMITEDAFKLGGLPSVRRQLAPTQPNPFDPEGIPAGHDPFGLSKLPAVQKNIQRTAPIPGVDMLDLEHALNALYMKLGRQGKL